MADRKITELSAMSAGGQATGDLLTIVDVSEAAAADKNKKMTMENLFKGIPGAVGIGVSNPGDFSSKAETLVLANGGDHVGITLDCDTDKEGSIFFADGSSGSNLFRGQVVYNHSGDSLRFVTNASERMRVDSTGRLLVGTTSTLDGSSEAIVHVSDSLGARLVLGRNDTSVSDGNGLGGIRFAGNDTTSNTFTTLGEILCQADGTHAAGDNPTRLTFKTTPDGSSTVTERMRIDSSGNVGIGTTSPRGNLHLHSSSGAPRLDFTNTATGTASTDGATFSVDGSSGGLNIIQREAQPIQFYTSNSEQMRIDSSGRVLVGTTSSRSVRSIAANVQVEGTSANASSLSLTRNADSLANAYLLFAKTRGTSVGSNTIVQDNDKIGAIEFAGADGTDTNSRAATIDCRVDGTPGSNDMPGRLVFSTTADGASTPTDRLIIDSAGAITTDNSAYAFLRSDSTTVTSLTLRKDASGADSVDYFQCRNTANTLKLVIQGDGDVANVNNSYGSVSDSKLKENIVDASSQWSDIKNLQVRNYNFTETSGHPTHTQIGLIAQEVETVSPGLVNDKPDVDEDGNDLGTVTKSVRYSVLYMKAVKALQEAMDRIETLEAKVAALEAQ